METERILLSNKDFLIKDALDKIDIALEDLNLGPKDTLHVRLIAEETLGMFSAMAGEYNGLVWFETKKDECHVKLVSKTEMDIEKKKEIMSVVIFCSPLDFP